MSEDEKLTTYDPKVLTRDLGLVRLADLTEQQRMELLDQMTDGKHSLKIALARKDALLREVVKHFDITESDVGLTQKDIELYDKIREELGEK